MSHEDYKHIHPSIRNMADDVPEIDLKEPISITESRVISASVVLSLVGIKVFQVLSDIYLQ